MKTGHDVALPSPKRRLLINAREAREMLGLGRERFDELVRRNAIPCHWIGGTRHFQPRLLEGWVAAGCPQHEGAAGEVEGRAS